MGVGWRYSIRWSGGATPGFVGTPPPSGWQGVYLGSINTDLSAEECYSALLYQYVAGTTLTKPTLPPPSNPSSGA